MHRLLPRKWPYWVLSISWDAYPFRVLYLGFWMVSIDRSGAWWTRWPHIKMIWNDDE